MLNYIQQIFSNASNSLNFASLTHSGFSSVDQYILYMSYVLYSRAVNMRRNKHIIIRVNNRIYQVNHIKNIHRIIVISKPQQHQHSPTYMQRRKIVRQVQQH